MHGEGHDTVPRRRARRSSSRPGSVLLRSRLHAERHDAVGPRRRARSSSSRLGRLLLRVKLHGGGAGLHAEGHDAVGPLRCARGSRLGSVLLRRRLHIEQHDAVGARRCVRSSSSRLGSRGCKDDTLHVGGEVRHRSEGIVGRARSSAESLGERGARGLRRQDRRGEKRLWGRGGLGGRAPSHGEGRGVVGVGVNVHVDVGVPVDVGFHVEGIVSRGHIVTTLLATARRRLLISVVVERERVAQSAALYSEVSQLERGN